MDVRCEKCQTVYEFDDAKVTAAGVTVKCTQCGNLFKVRRRPSPTTGAQASAPPRNPTPVGGVPPIPERQRTSTMPRGSPSPVLPPRSPTPARGVPMAPASPPVGAPGDERVWMVRLAASGEVKRFRELTTLQQWIVEKRVTRDDEISRSGETWKRLGGIAELASFFHVVEQAEQRAYAPTMALSADENPALSTTAPMTAPSVPAARAQVAFSGPMVNLPPARGPQALAATAPAIPSLKHAPGADLAEPELDDELPRRGPKTGLILGIAAAVLALAGGGVVIAKKVMKGEEPRGSEAYRRGRELFQLDSDDQLRLAEQELLRAHGADEQSALPVAGLAELNAVWGGYLRDGSRAAEAAKQAPRAEELRKMSQAHLDDAKRYANEAKTLAPEDPDVNRAMAAFLLVDGAPAAQVEGFLNQAEAKRAGDPEAIWLRGALYYRDGKLIDAKVDLDRANQLNQAKAQRDLLRADRLLAEIAVAQGRRDDARALAQRMLDMNPKHERAREIVAETAQPPPAPTPPPVAAPPDAGAAAAPPTAQLPDKGDKKDKPKAPSDEEEEPRGGADGLIAQGNRLLERGGRTKDAQKLFEKALALSPTNVEALNGLGYCFLDTEHFNNAIDTFKKTLNQSPSNGDAILGLAEAYKMRGDKPRALDYYKKYMSDLPNGSKIRMAQTNANELEEQIKKAAPPPAPEVHDAPPTPAPAPPP